MATGGSTNAVLHILAIAHAADVEWTIDDFERVRTRVPVICDLKPSGKYLVVDFHKAGGIPQVMKMLLNARSEEHTSELQSLMRISYAVFCLKKKTEKTKRK